MATSASTPTSSTTSIPAGISLGIGLEVKYTIGALAAAIWIAILFTPTLGSDLRTRYPWIAAGIALLIGAPNLAWKVEKGFPLLVYIANHQGSGGGLVANVVLIVVYLFFLIPLCSLAGARYCRCCL